MEKKFSDMIQVSAKGSMILMLGRMLTTAISAIGTIVVARFLGSQSFGALSVALIPISVSLLLVNNGSQSAVIKFLAQYNRDNDEEKIQEIIVNGLFFNVTIGLIVTLILFTTSDIIANRIFHEPELSYLLRILSISVFFQSLVNTSTGIIIGFERMKQSIVLSITQSIANTLIGPILIISGMGLVGAAYGYTLPIIISGIVALFLVLINHREKLSVRNAVSIEAIRTIYVYTLPLFLTNLIAGGAQRIYDFLLSVNTSTEVMGNYSAATSFSVLIQFFISPISTATFPLLSKLKPKDPVFKMVYQNIIKYESMIIFPITFAIIGLSDHLVSILYGPTYILASSYMQLFMLNFLFIGIGRVVNVSLLNSQQETHITFIATLIQLLGIPMGFYLIPRFGVLGYIITLLIAPKISLLYTLIWINRNYGIAPDFKVVGTLFFSSIVGFILCKLCLNLISFNPWIELFIGGLVIMGSYLILILGLGAIRKENFRDIQKLLFNYSKFEPLIDPIFNILIRVSRE